MKVIVCDGHYDVRESVAIQLTEISDFQVITAVNGQELVRQIERVQPHLVITHPTRDLNIDEIILFAKEHSPKTKFILMSGWGSVLHDHDVHGSLQKPFTYESLRTGVMKVMDRHVCV